jgi:hypothetical protein
MLDVPGYATNGFTHPHLTKENQVMKGQMNVIGFEEHYGLPFIHDAALKANDPYAEVLEAMRKSGQFPEDPRTVTPTGIYDLAEGRIAAMGNAGNFLEIKVVLNLGG